MTATLHDTPLVNHTAAKGVIWHDHKILLIRETDRYVEGTPNAGLYDVVGGRLEPGESWEEGLTREIREEAGLSIQTMYPFYTATFRVPRPSVIWNIAAVFFAVIPSSIDICLSKDHDHFIWWDPNTPLPDGVRLLSGYDKMIEQFNLYNRYIPFDEMGQKKVAA